MSPSGLVVRAALPSDLPCIENLMQFYNYDYSAWAPMRLAQQGKYVLRPKAAYWAQPGVRPFLFEVDGELAGFAVVDQELVHADSEFNLGYFFVVRRFQGLGWAQQAALQLFGRMAGRWEVASMVSHRAAEKFWGKLLQPPHCQELTQSVHTLDNALFHVRRFWFVG